MDKLLLVDGSNLLFQMFFGMPARIVNQQGKSIQGTLGFVGALLKIIRMVKPTHVAVLFDGEYISERVELDENYKANRAEDYRLEEESPFTQLPDIYAALDYLGICRAETTVCETDDWMAGFALSYGNDMEIVISSFDSDFFQLITEKVSVLRYRGEKTVVCTPAYIREKLGIEPEQYAFFKSLTGDSADNIRGAEKIGPKTAALLVNQFADLEQMIARSEQIQKPSIRKSVTQNADRIRKNYQLIRLQTGAQLPFGMEQLRYTDPGITTMQVLQEIGLR